MSRRFGERKKVQAQKQKVAMRGVKVKITKSYNYSTPFGLEYEAKGFYIQKKHMIIVGELNRDNTMRIKYPKDDVQINILY